MDSHFRQVVAVVIAVVTFLLFFKHGRSPITHFSAIWDIYAIVVALMAWITICTAIREQFSKKLDLLQDSSRALIFAFMIVAACMSLLAVILVLQEHKALQKNRGTASFHGSDGGD